MNKKNILITGRPGCGKTTMVRRLVSQLEGRVAAGFHTGEIKEDGSRAGFELASLGGEKSLLSHIKIKGPYRVGRYGVDVDGFDRFLSLIPFSAPETQLIVIDEIGRMECFSRKFMELCEEALDSSAVVLATVALMGDGFISRVKKRADVRIFELTVENRDRIEVEILSYIHQLQD